MVRRDHKPPGQIEPVGIVPLHAGIEMHLIATLLLRQHEEPVEHPAGVPVLARGRAGGKIVQVKRAPPGKVARDAKPGDAHDLIFRLDEGHPVARFGLLRPHPADERRRVEMRAEFAYARETTLDVAIGLRDADRSWFGRPHRGFMFAVFGRDA